MTDSQEAQRERDRLIEWCEQTAQQSLTHRDLPAGKVGDWWPELLSIAALLRAPHPDPDTARLDWYEDHFAHIGVNVAPSGAVASAYRRWLSPNEPVSFDTLRAAIDAAITAAQSPPPRAEEARE